MDDDFVGFFDCGGDDWVGVDVVEDVFGDFECGVGNYFCCVCELDEFVE